MPANDGLDRSGRLGERTKGVVDADKERARARRVAEAPGTIKAADPLCAPHLAQGESIKAVTSVQGTAMCEDHAREWFGEVITRG